jgi:hypothetical protein
MPKIKRVTKHDDGRLETPMELTARQREIPILPGFRAHVRS